MKNSLAFLFALLFLVACKQEKKSIDATVSNDGFTVVSDAVSYQLIGVSTP